MDSENIKISDPHRPLLNLLDKKNLKRSDKYVALSNLSIYYTWKNINKSHKNNKLKISAFGMKSLNYLMNHILYLKKHETVTDNPSIIIYVNKIENRITFEIKTGYYLELLTPEAIKLLGRTKYKINKDKNGENVPHLKITEVVLIQWRIQRVLDAGIPIWAPKLCAQIIEVFEIKFSYSSLNCENLCCKHFTFHKKAY